MYVRVRELGLHYLDLATQEITEFQRVMRALNLRNPAVSPRPSYYIVEIARNVQDLLDSDVAHRLEGGDIYFEVSRSAVSGCAAVRKLVLGTAPKPSSMSPSMCTTTRTRQL